MRPRAGDGLRALAGACAPTRAWRASSSSTAPGLRFQPNDPALTRPRPRSGPRPARRWSGGRRAAASRAPGTCRPAPARSSRSSTPASTTSASRAGRPRDRGAASFDATPRVGDDRHGRARHARRLAGLRRRQQRHRAGRRRACAAGCSIVKSDFSDSSVAEAIVWAVDHGADAINMSFGTDPGTRAQPGRARRDRLRARARRRAWSPPPPTTPIAEQGYPANLLQPTRHRRPTSADGKGLSVTAADASDAPRVVRRAAAARSRWPPTAPTTPAARRAARDLRRVPRRARRSSRPARSGCRRARRAAAARRFAGDPATPTCRALDGGPDGRRPPARSCATSTPTSAPPRSCGCSRRPRAAPRGTGWTADLGWGILDAGAAVARAREHRPPRAVLARQARCPPRTASGRSPCAGTRGRPGAARRRARRASRASSCGARPTAGASGAVLDHRARRAGVTAAPGRPLRASTRVAVDHAGNRERRAEQADARIRASRSPRRSPARARAARALLARERQQLGQRRLDALGDRRRCRAARRSRRAGRSSCAPL